MGSQDKCLDEDLEDYEPKNEEKLLESEYKLLEEVLGKRINNESEFDRFVGLFLVSIVAAILLVILFLRPVDSWFVKNIPNYEYRLCAKALILFVVVFIVNALITDWRVNSF